MKKYCSLILAMIMIYMMSISVWAVSNNVVVNDSDKIDLGSVNVNIDSIEYFQDATLAVKTVQNNDCISAVKLTSDNQNIILSVTQDDHLVEFNGKLYTALSFDKDTHQIELEKKTGIILGEFEEIGNQNISNFKLQRSGPSNNVEVVFTIEDMKTGELSKVSGVSSLKDFDVMQKIAVKHTKEFLDDVPSIEKKAVLTEKIVSLIRNDANFKNSDNIRLTEQRNINSRSRSSYMYSTKNSNTGRTVSKTKLRNFFSDIADYQGSGIYDCTSDTAIRQLLTQTGWRTYTSKTSKYFYVMYGMENGPEEYLVQISYGEMKKAWHENNNVNAEFEVMGSLLLSYDTVSKLASVVYYDVGVKMTSGQFYLAVDSESPVYFTQATKIHVFETTENQLSLGYVLKSMYTGLDIAFTAFSRPNLYVSETTAFYDTDTGAADCLMGENYIWGAGGKMGVSGLVVGTGTESTCGYDFQFECSHNL